MELRWSQLDLNKYCTLDQGEVTPSFLEQQHVEQNVSLCFESFKKKEDQMDKPVLERALHVKYLLKGLTTLSESYECLDASRPWLCYWILHSLELLNEPVPDNLATEVAGFLKRCQDPDGGFCGGPGQVAHLAPTYAAVNALCILGTEEAYNVIDRSKLLQFLLRMKLPNGAFIMHNQGETDIRGAYCAASVATLTNISTPELFENTPQWIVSCQTYEGGFAGGPGLEAHGGYSFCGLAALELMGHEKLCDLDALLRWTVNRQMSYEGGFQGRTNKLVDGCYSFWQGGVFPVIHAILAAKGDTTLSASSWLYDQGALQEYILLCCQHQKGGLRDKPWKSRDFYHTCYCLSGLSVAQHFASGTLKNACVLGDKTNKLRATHPVFNICPEAVQAATEYFSQQSPVVNK